MMYGEKRDRETPPSVTVRETTMDDIVDFRRVQGLAWLETYPSPENGVSEEWVQEQVSARFSSEGLQRSEEFIAKVLKDPSQIHRVAVQDDKIVGFAHASTHDDGIKELLAIYVDPSAFSGGIGTQLMEVVSDWAEGTEMCLTVAEYNDRAIGFYKKHGFKLVPGSESTYREVIPVIDMVREKTV